MNQEIQPLFEVDAIKVAVGGTPDPEVAALPVQVGINLPKPTPHVPGEAQRSTLNSPQLVSQSR